MSGICCSIELEPKTLSESQLIQAREVAADVVQKLNPDEASNLFIEGLAQSDAVKEMKEDRKVVEAKKQPLECKSEVTDEKACQLCLCSIKAVSESPDYSATLKEPLSAPF